MKFQSILVALLVLCCPVAWAAFTYVGTYNGTNPDDPGDAQKFTQPTGLFYEGGKLYVADSGKNSLYVMDGSYAFNSTSRLKIILSQASEGSLSNPLRMNYEDGKLYIADGSTGKIKYYSGEGSTIDSWNTGTNIGSASGVAMDNGSFYIADSTKKRLVVYSRQTKSYSRIGVDTGSSDGQLSAPADVRIYGGMFYISDSEKNLVFVYDSNLAFDHAIGRGKGDVELRSPRGIKLYNDRLYVADKNNNRVVVFTLDGYPVETLSSSPAMNFSYPEDIAAGDGKLYVADSGNGMVHIFSINYSSSNDSVLQGISAANYSAAQLQKLQQAADRLGVAYSNVSFGDDLASARKYYDDLIFSSASAISQRVVESSLAEQATLGASLDVKERQVAATAQATVEPYRQGAASGELAPALASFDDTASQLQSRLSSRDYAAAAGLALDLQKSANDFAAAAQEKLSGDKARAKDRQIALVAETKSGLEARLAAAKSKAASYSQPADFSNLEALMAQAGSQIGSGDLEGANHSLSLAAFEISSFESALSSMAREIDAALANMTVLEFEFNSSAAKPMLLPPSLGAERQMLSQARVTAYSNPQLGIAMATQARDSARAKAKDAQTLSVAASALLMMLGLIGAIAAAFFLHIRGRRRKQEAAKAAKPEEKKKRQGQ